MTKKNKDFNFGDEFQAQPETAETHELNDASTESADSTERTMYTLKDGSEGSRAAYIRELFLEDNLSRKEIAEQTGFPYRIVYSATVNMTNDAEPAGRGRSVTNATIKVYGEDDTLVTENKYGEYFDVATGDSVDASVVVEINRNDWIREQVDAGVSRGDVAKALDLSYGVIYNLTKEQSGTRVKHDVTLEDGTTISRSEYIRNRYSEGETRSNIAKELDVPYSVVWQATKTEKSDADRFAELVEQIKAFADRAVDENDFAMAIEALEAVEIAVSDEDEAESAAAEASEA